MPVDVELDALRGLDGGELVDEGCRLGGVACGGAAEVLGAGAGGGAAGDVPLVGPVAVDVVAETGAAAGGLPVLAPETVVGLGVEEAWWMLVSYSSGLGERCRRELTIRVDDWEEVEVVLVDPALGLGIGRVVAHESLGDILHNL